MYCHYLWIGLDWIGLDYLEDRSIRSDSTADDDEIFHTAGSCWKTDGSSNSKYKVKWVSSQFTIIPLVVCRLRRWQN